MNSTERKDFEHDLAILFGAYPGVRLSEANIEAYWRGLARMSLVTFRRVMDRIMDPEHGEDRLPSPKRIWQIARELVSESRANAQLPAKPTRSSDAFDAHGNRVLLSYLQTHGGASLASIKAMVAAKNKLVADYRLICEEEPQASLELRDKLIEAFDRTFERMPREELERALQSFERLHYVGDLA